MSETTKKTNTHHQGSSGPSGRNGTRTRKRCRGDRRHREPHAHVGPVLGGFSETRTPRVHSLLQLVPRVRDRLTNLYYSRGIEARLCVTCNYLYVAVQCTHLKVRRRSAHESYRITHELEKVSPKTTLYTSRQLRSVGPYTVQKEKKGKGKN